MKPGGIELRWAYVAFGLLAGIDVLVGIRILQRMVWNHGAGAPVFVLLLLGLHLVLLWLFYRVRSMVRYDQHLRSMYEQELGFAQQLLDASTEGLLMFSSKGVITYANRRAAEVMGHPPEALPGRSSRELFAPEPEDRAATQEQWQQSWARSGEVYHLRLRDAQGQWRRVRLTSSPRWHQGRVVGSFGSVRPDDRPDDKDPASQPPA